MYLIICHYRHEAMALHFKLYYPLNSQSLCEQCKDYSRRPKANAENLSSYLCNNQSYSEQLWTFR
jgi:hypothetical protein